MKFYLLLFIFICLPVIAEEGPIILIGGGTIPKQAIKWMKEKSHKNKFLIITCDKDLNKKWNEFFEQTILLFPEELNIKEIEDTGGIIIEGGDQLDYLKKLDGKVIDEAHKRGIPILGTSAGAMILGSDYFSAEKGTITSEEAEAGERICLGKNFISIKLLENTIVETHFSERNRQRRLKVFMERSGATRGFGIDEATALCIDEDGKQFTFGEGHVEIVMMQH